MSNGTDSLAKHAIPTFNRDLLMEVLDHPGRLAILAELCAGEHLAASDFARLARCSLPAATKHGQLLVRAGMLLKGRGKLYRLVPGIQTQPGKRELEFGHCLLRLDFQAGT